MAKGRFNLIPPTSMGIPRVPRGLSVTKNGVKHKGQTQRLDTGTGAEGSWNYYSPYKIFRLFLNRNKAKRLKFTQKNFKINTLSTAKYQTSSRLIFPFTRKGPTNLVNRLKKQVGLHNPVLFSKILTCKSTTFDLTECASGVCLCVRGRGVNRNFFFQKALGISKNQNQAS